MQCRILCAVVVLIMVGNLGDHEKGLVGWLVDKYHLIGTMFITKLDGMKNNALERCN